MVFSKNRYNRIEPEDNKPSFRSSFPIHALILCILCDQFLQPTRRHCVNRSPRYICNSFSPSLPHRPYGTIAAMACPSAVLPSHRRHAHCSSSSSAAHCPSLPLPPTVLFFIFIIFYVCCYYCD